MSLARRQPQALSTETHPDTEVVRDRVPILYAFGELIEMATFLAESGLIKGVTTAQQAFTLILFAQSQNLHPGTIVGRYHVIEGVPSMKSDVMLAEFQAGGGKIEWVESDGKVCKATFSHPALHPKPFTVAVSLQEMIENETALRWDKYKNAMVLKETYRKNPAAMLRARVITAGIRAINPGALHGIYAPEEIDVFSGEAPPEGMRPATLPPPSPAALPISARSVDSPPPSAVVAPASPDAVRLNTQDGESHDARPYHVVIEQEVQALNGEIVIRNHEAKRIERHQFHRHMIKAAGAAGLTEPVAEGTKLSTSQVLERCQDLYRDHRDWTRAEIRAYGDKLFQAVQPAPTKEAESETDKQVLDAFDREPGADG